MIKYFVYDYEYIYTKKNIEKLTKNFNFLDNREYIEKQTKNIINFIYERFIKFL